ncbi:MAG TPA: glycoside hydrolase family 130 protein [Polyangiaceae bacterium]|nr:glycoside hydrolase family 130 protein [Polyangiaceae bacterium]
MSIVNLSVQRSLDNPIIVPAKLSASLPDFEVVGVFNPAAIRVGEDTMLLLRVAEAPRNVPADHVASPIYDPELRRVIVRAWPKNTPGLDTSDSRLVVIGKDTFLTSLSHFRRARSRDGVHFEVEAKPAFSPGHALEAFGVEDPRITRIDDTYWINYTAVSSAGITTALASSRDLLSFERHGVIFSPPNRDVTIFPEQIKGRYFALHRPMPEDIGRPAIWLASSPDLLAWGEHRLVASARAGMWDDLKIGGGAVPFRVDAGGRSAWLAVYHGVTASPLTYSLGALLLDADDPGKVLGRSQEPILFPEAPYELKGFFANVVFTCGLTVDGDRVRVYYGASDGVTCTADLSLRGILAGLA